MKARRRWVAAVTEKGQWYPFRAKEFGRFLKVKDIQHRTSTPLWLQGKVRKCNRGLSQALRIAKTEKKNIWSEIRELLTAYRAAPHSSRVNPAKLLFNRKIRSKIAELWNWRYSEASDGSAIKQQRTDYADEKRRVRESDLVAGDLVLLKQYKENNLSTKYVNLP